MEPTTNNGGGKIITALIIGLLVGFTAGVFWQERRSNSDPEPLDVKVKVSEEKSGEKKSTESTVTPVTSSDTAKPTSTTLTVLDQVAGNQVRLQELDATEVMWVAVREEKNGTIGNILGASKVFVGSDQNVTVELLRPTVSGNTYRVVLYRDVGALDFNHKEDVLISDREGRFIAK